MPTILHVALSVYSQAISFILSMSRWLESCHLVLYFPCIVGSRPVILFYTFHVSLARVLPSCFILSMSRWLASCHLVLYFPCLVGSRPVSLFSIVLSSSPPPQQFPLYVFIKNTLFRSNDLVEHYETPYNNREYLNRVL